MPVLLFYLFYRLTQMVREYVDAADIGKRGSCHLFRHTMATLMLENGADVRFIQAMLGHAKLETTQIYTQVSIRKLKEIHEATHPAKLHRESEAPAEPSFNGEPQAPPSSSQGEAPACRADRSASVPPIDEKPSTDSEAKGEVKKDSDEEEPPLAAVPK